MQRAADEHDRAFVWRDAGRTVVCREGLAADAVAVLGEHGFGDFDVLTTPGRRDAAPRLVEAAREVHEVPAGPVPRAAANLLEHVRADALVALGGGRVIDTAKAIAAVTGARVAAIPTTMSGAEMTGFHRLPAGAEDRARGLVRPAVVLAEPPLMTGQEEQELRASSLNAMAHGVDSLYTPYANPVSSFAAMHGSRLISMALDEPPADRDVSALARGSLLCGYAIDSGLFGIHHVVCQTLVAVCGTSHAETNAVMLPLAIESLTRQAPAALNAYAEAVRAEPGRLSERIAELAGPQPSLGEQGGDAGSVEEAIEAMLARPQLGNAPDPPDAAELRRMVQAAW